MEVIFIVAAVSSLCASSGDLSYIWVQLPEYVASASITLFVFGMLDKIIPGKKMFS